MNSHSLRAELSLGVFMGWLVFHKSTILAAHFVPESTNLAPRGAKHGRIAARKYIQSTDASDTPFRHGQVLPDHPLDLLAGLRVQLPSHR
ncbi:MAG: hypothetical protein WB543_15225 [Candidatus Acidiferrum sp.]